MDVPIQHCKKLAVFYQLSPQFLMKTIQQFGPNIIIFHMATYEQRWYIIGFYLDPDDDLMLESVVAEL